MPIYAYRCEHCGHAQDVLQKVSDPVLTVCPACGQPTYRKQVTAAGFQLKGSGWYVTDFKGDRKPAARSPEGAAAAEGQGASASGAEAGAKAGEGSANGTPAAADGKNGASTKGEGAKGDAKATTSSAAPAAKPAAPKTGDA